MRSPHPMVPIALNGAEQELAVTFKAMAENMNQRIARVEQSVAQLAQVLHGRNAAIPRQSVARLYQIATAAAAPGPALPASVSPVTALAALDASCPVVVAPAATAPPPPVPSLGGTSGPASPLLLPHQITHHARPDDHAHPHSRPHHQPPFHPRRHPEAAPAPAPAPGGNDDDARLPRFEVEGLPAKWYTKRPMPEFTVRLVDHDGRPRRVPPQSYVTVGLVTGHGIVDNGSLLRAGPSPDNKANTSNTNSASSGSNPPLRFPIDPDGRAAINGLRFQAVSSKNGKTFTLHFSCTSCDTAASRSAPLVILSERLKNEHKAAAVSDLSPSDPIARVPGLGKSYCQRLNQLGFRTVEDLATIPIAPADRPVRIALLNKLRKDRGALTEARLMHLVREAHHVVAAAAATEPQHKRGLDAASADQQQAETEEQLAERKLGLGWTSAPSPSALLQSLSEPPRHQDIDAMINFDSMDALYPS